MGGERGGPRGQWGGEELRAQDPGGLTLALGSPMALGSRRASLPQFPHLQGGDDHDLPRRAVVRREQRAKRWLNVKYSHYFVS